MNPSNMQSVLEKPDQNRYWATAKLEYIFDNTRSLGINLYGGTRMKFFGEYYQQLNDRMYNLFVFGLYVSKVFSGTLKLSGASLQP